MATYKIEDVKDGEVTFKKSCITHEFTDKALIDNWKDLKKKEKEIKAQKKLEESKMENYLHFNEFIKDLTEEQLHAVYLYQQSLSVKNVSERKLKQIEEAKKDIKEAVKEIKEQTGRVIKLK